MIADTQKQQQQTPSALTEDDNDALKRNTDCVYFLASPLTCKKGTECEYRHSEYARVNPRDCWFWLNGNCLNPKCSFRHPPLDGLSSIQVDIPVRSSLLPSQPAVSAATQVPCIFFQKGMCFKGDRCAFLHGPNPINNKVQLAPTASSVTEPPSFKRTFGGLAKCTQEQKISQASIRKPIEIPSNVKPTGRTEATLMKNEVFDRKYLRPTTPLDAEIRCKQSIVPAAINGITGIQPNHRHQSHVSNDPSFQNGKDPDEFIRESSPGFDVLVDDELGDDDDDYHNENQHGRTRGHEDQFDLARSADHSSIFENERERFHDPHGLNSYCYMQGQHAQGQHAQGQHRSLSERKYVETTRVERSYPEAENLDQIDAIDLRHRLSKQRRVSGVKSVLSSSYDRESHIEEQNDRRPQRDSSFLPPKENSISSRFRGRINLSQKPLPSGEGDLCLEKDYDRQGNWGRLSLGKPQISSLLGRLRDRVSGLVEENFIDKGREFRAPSINRDITNGRATDFTGPKSLAELKGGKTDENMEQSFSSGRQRDLKIDSHQHSEGDLLFEGPKPLSVILKRKREAEAAVSRGVTFCDNNEDGNKKENKAGLPCSSKTSVIESAIDLYSHPEKEINNQACNNHGEYKSASAASSQEAERNVLAYGQSSGLPIVNGLMTEDDMVLDKMEDQELEAYDQRDGDYDYDYEHLSGADLDGEEDEDMDDDFAKKIGVMLT